VSRHHAICVIEVRGRPRAEAARVPFCESLERRDDGSPVVALVTGQG